MKTFQKKIGQTKFICKSSDRHIKSIDLCEVQIVSIHKIHGRMRLKCCILELIHHQNNTRLDVESEIQKPTPNKCFEWIV